MAILLLCCSLTENVYAAVLSCELYSVSDSADGNVIFEDHLKLVDLQWTSSGISNNRVRTSLKAEDGQKNTLSFHQNLCHLRSGTVPLLLDTSAIYHLKS